MVVGLQSMEDFSPRVCNIASAVCSTAVWEIDIGRIPGGEWEL